MPSSPLEVPFLVPRWRERAAVRRPSASGEHWVLVTDDLEFARAVEAVADVRLSTVADPAAAAALTGSVDGILHLIDTGPTDDQVALAERSFARVLALGAALAERPAPARPLRVVVVTTGAEPGAAVVAGPATALGFEVPWVSVRTVDVDVADPARLAAELAADADGPVALRDGRRFVLDHESGPRHEPAATPFRSGGTYLVTGGFGAIGGALVRRITEVEGTTVVRLGRHGVDGTERVGGSTVRSFACDVADADQLAGVLAATGPVDGVLHAAGVLSRQRLTEVDGASAAAVLAPKIAGTVHLDRLCPDAEFVALFSSVMTLTGAHAHGAYVAANNFLDAYAEARSGDRRVVSIGWPMWGEVFGMAPPAQDAPGDAVRGWLTTAEGIELCEGILAQRPAPRVAICPAGLAEQWAKARARAAAAH